MRFPRNFVLWGLAAASVLSADGAGRLSMQSSPGSPPSLAEGFRSVPLEDRMRMYWRIFGPAWTEPEIDRQLALMKRAGLGGATAYFLYPVELDDPGRGIVNQRFGSPEFLRTFGYAARKARELGLRFSANAGTGWPFGGPVVAPGDAALRLREVRGAKGSSPAEAVGLAAGEAIVAAFLDGRNVTPAVRAGRLPDPLPGELRVYVSGPTGMQVKRAAFGGEGHVLSHYDRGALERWLAAVAAPVLEAAPGLVEALGCDSLEVYRSNWMPDLPREFRRRRGYDLVSRLPELFDEAGPARKALRFDLWRTLAELTEERFTRPLGRWCESRGVRLEMEPYGMPPNPMTACRYISAPTGEHYEWKGFAVQRYVASMARLAGRRIVGAEAWTWAGLPNRLGDSLSDIKLTSDMTFLCGANDLTGVDFPYSPEAAGAPGWLPYFGPVFGPGNPQWAHFPALVAYLNRCQWLLRQGDPVRSVAVYLPVEDAFSDGPADQMLLDFLVRDRLATGHPTSEFGLANGLRHHSDLLDGIAGAGYGYDGLDFWAVTRLGAVHGGRLFAGAAAYEAVVLPSLERIDAAALARIEAFCRAGGIVVAARRLPDRAPGALAARDLKRVKRTLARLFGESPRPGAWHRCGRGKAILVAEDRDAGPALREAIAPSVRFEPRPATVGFVHRRAGDRDIFFFANVGPESVRFGAGLPGPARRVERWDAMTGEIDLLAEPAERVEIALPARGSIFLVAGERTTEARPQAAEPEPAALQAREIGGPWLLSFDGPDAPSPARLSRLASWTDLPGGRFFSGLGVYRTAFDFAGPLPSRALLTFDAIREAAEVRLNGRSLGTVFNPPLEIDATGALRTGSNDLEIVVSNLPLNRFLGLPDRDLGPLRARFGNRFGAPEEKRIAAPAASGLIGAARLVMTAAR